MATVRRAKRIAAQASDGFCPARLRERSFGGDQSAALRDQMLLIGELADPPQKGSCQDGCPR